MKTILIIVGVAVLLGAGAAVATELLNQDRFRKNDQPLPESYEGYIPKFENIASRIGLRGQPKGSKCSANAAGVAWINLDGKGSPELALSSYSGKSLIWSVNEKRASVIQDLGRIGGATGLSSVDYDNDGKEDLLMSTQNGPLLFHNSQGRLKDVTKKSGLLQSKLGMMGAWGDLNRDGLLDLVITRGKNCADQMGEGNVYLGHMEVYLQEKPGVFRMVNRILLSERPAKALGMAVALTDLNNDGWLDIYLANDYKGGVKNQAWRNVGGRRFVPGFPSAEIKIFAMGIGLGDINGDLRTDLSISDLQPINLLINEPSGFKRERLASYSYSHIPATWGMIMEDFNNDGFEDIWSASGSIATFGGFEGSGGDYQVFFLNRGNNEPLLDVGSLAGLNAKLWGRATAMADINRDGLPDMALGVLDKQPGLFINRGSEQRGNWIDIKLSGSPAMGSPRDPCGAKVLLSIDGRRWMRELECGSEGYLSSSEKVLHFGLGKLAGKASVKVLWPSGSSQGVSGLELNQRHLLKESLSN